MNITDQELLSDEEMSFDGSKNEGSRFNRFMVDGQSEGNDSIYN